MSMETPMLEINDISCQVGGAQVVNGLTLHLRQGSIGCLLGPSGCGKTTALRAIAGFQSLQAGEILLDGVRIADANQQWPPEKRGLGMVFQEYALFPHLNLADNISFGLKRHTIDQKRNVVSDMLDLVGMSGYEQRYPHELSGGQQQRIALARALAPRPKLLLLDEPLSNLDVELRERLATDVRDILHEQGTTALFVTHDQHEAFLMGDKVGVMNHGRILQWDTPFNLYHEPADRFIADFIGQGVLLEGNMASENSVNTEIGLIEGNRAYPWRDGTAVDVLLRPDDIIIDVEGGIPCKVIDRAFKGAETLYKLKLPSGAELLSLTPSHLDHAKGDEVHITTQMDHLILFHRSD